MKKECFLKHNNKLEGPCGPTVGSPWSSSMPPSLWRGWVAPPKSMWRQIFENFCQFN